MKIKKKLRDVKNTLTVNRDATRKNPKDVFPPSAFEFLPGRRFDRFDNFKPTQHNKYFLKLSRKEMEFLEGVDLYISGEHDVIKLFCLPNEWTSNSVFFVLLAKYNMLVAEGKDDVAETIRKLALGTCEIKTNHEPFDWDRLPYARKWCIDGVPEYAKLYSALFDEYEYDPWLRMSKFEDIPARFIDKFLDPQRYATELLTAYDKAAFLSNQKGSAFRLEREDRVRNLYHALNNCF